MQRQRRRNNYNRSVKPRGRQLARTRNGFTQRSNGASHTDNVPQVRKFQIFKELKFENASSDYAFGVTKFNIEGKQSPLLDLISAYQKLYEQYRIRKINVRAQVGKGYDNDKRIKTIVGCRVDVDQQDTTATVANLQAINSAENTILRTFTNRGNILLAKYRPQCRVLTDQSTPILPNQLQFYPVEGVKQHVWKGVIATCMIPEPSIEPNSLAITLMAEVDVEFRGRVTNPEIFGTTNTVNQTEETTTYDLEGPQDELRIFFLQGHAFPISGFENINVANIGHSVTPAQIMGAVFRDQSSGNHYEIVHYVNEPEWVYGANQVPNAD